MYLPTGAVSRCVVRDITQSLPTMTLFQLGIFLCVLDAWGRQYRRRSHKFTLRILFERLSGYVHGERYEGSDEPQVLSFWRSVYIMLRIAERGPAYSCTPFVDLIKLVTLPKGSTARVNWSGSVVTACPTGHGGRCKYVHGQHSDTIKQFTS